MNPPAFVPLQEMKACAIFENPEFLRTLQHSILSDLFREGKRFRIRPLPAGAAKALTLKIPPIHPVKIMLR